jgi:hypothetical protein
VFNTTVALIECTKEEQRSAIQFLWSEAVIAHEIYEKK